MRMPRLRPRARPITGWVDLTIERLKALTPLRTNA